MPNFGGIDLVEVLIPGQGLYYTAADGSWSGSWDAITAAVIASPFQIAVVAAMNTVIRNFGPDTTPHPTNNGSRDGYSEGWLQLYRDPTSVVASTAGMSGSPDVTVDIGSTPVAGHLNIVAAGVELLPGQFYNQGPFTFALDNRLSSDVTVQHCLTPTTWYVTYAQGLVPPNSVVVPVNTPTPPPTGIVNPTTVPPSVQLRQQIQKANPGFTCDITRHEYYRDLVQVFLGQKILMHVESYGNKLGMVNRGNVVTQTRFRWKASGGSSPRKEFTSLFRLEAIPGTLLPGAGTSTAAQDMIGAGADIGMFHELDVDGTGLDLGMLAS